VQVKYQTKSMNPDILNISISETETRNPGDLSLSLFLSLSLARSLLIVRVATLKRGECEGGGHAGKGGDGAEEDSNPLERGYNN